MSSSLQKSNQLFQISPPLKESPDSFDNLQKARNGKFNSAYPAGLGTCITFANPISQDSMVQGNHQLKPKLSKAPKPTASFTQIAFMSGDTDYPEYKHEACSIQNLGWNQTSLDKIESKKLNSINLNPEVSLELHESHETSSIPYIERKPHPTDYSNLSVD